MTPRVGSGYRLVETAPPIRDYLLLRELAGLPPKSSEQAAAGLPCSWAVCHVIYETNERCVGRGRVIGDGGWYFHIIDLAVLPEHPRRSLGRAVLTSLIDRIRAHAPAGATTTCSPTRLDDRYTPNTASSKPLPLPAD